MVWFSETRPAFQRNIFPPSSGLKSEPRKKALLAASFLMVSCLVYTLTLKMEVIYSSNTSVDFH
jgi:hypothetical protein